jgi:hypothetical protein
MITQKSQVLLEKMAVVQLVNKLPIVMKHKVSSRCSNVRDTKAYWIRFKFSFFQIPLNVIFPFNSSYLVSPSLRILRLKFLGILSMSVICQVHNALLHMIVLITFYKGCRLRNLLCNFCHFLVTSSILKSRISRYTLRASVSQALFLGFPWCQLDIVLATFEDVIDCKTHL